ncbi:MAG: hypothetical protein QOH39_2585 [Verrucomicrobiota bacterium]|jgi:hypothetical protein
MVENLKWGYAPEGAKRRYEAHFVSKLTDCDGENSETDSSSISPETAIISRPNDTKN